MVTNGILLSKKEDAFWDMCKKNNINIQITDLQVGESDSIDIYKAKNIREVLKFLCKPIPFCRYCDMKGMSYGHKWQISKKDLKEWT